MFQRPKHFAMNSVIKTELAVCMNLGELGLILGGAVVLNLLNILVAVNKIPA